MTCGDRAVSGIDFYHEVISLISSMASLEKTLRKIRPALELINQSSESLGAGALPILELLENFRSWDASKPADKLFALLSLSSDASQTPSLQPDYTVPDDVLARRIVEFAFPTCVINKAIQTTGTEVTFEIEGLFLGDIGTKRGRDQRQEFAFAPELEPRSPTAVLNPRVLELFGRDPIRDDWQINIRNERKLQLRQTIVLLRGASRPTVLSFRDDKWTVVMLTTPEPIRSERQGQESTQIKAWDAALADLCSEPEGLFKFAISWDPFRKPNPSELSKHTLSPNDPIIQWEASLDVLKNQIECEGQTQHHLSCGDILALHMEFRSDERAVKVGTSRFTTTLHDAAYTGSVGTTKLLLDVDADVDAIMDRLGTSLHRAALEGHTKVVRALLDAHARIDLTDEDGFTPLTLASAQRHHEIERMLLDAGALPQPNGTVQKYLTRRLLDFAAEGDTEGVMKLLKAGADPNGVVEIAELHMHGVAGLHVAAELGDAETVATLLEACANANSTTSTGKTPLHQAAMGGHPEVVQLLLRAGAEVNAQDQGGTTPLDFALFKEHRDTARIIESAGGRNVNVGGSARRRFKFL